MAVDNFPCDGVVTEERVRLLMAQEAESLSLDYKQNCDLSSVAGKAEFVKDSAAMMSRPNGGYLLIGVDGNGRPVGADLDAPRFDEARLRPLLEKYLGSGVSVTSQVHDIDGAKVAVIFLGRRNDGLFPIVITDVTVRSAKGVETPVLRLGDVFVRDGTSSVRWAPRHLEELLKPYIERVRSEERDRIGEIVDQLRTADRGKLIAEGSVSGLTWQLSEEDFTSALTEAIRSGDSVIIQLALLNAKNDALEFRRARTEPGEFEFSRLLDRLTDALATGILFNETAVVDQALAGLRAAYSGATVAGEPSADELATRIWISITTRVLGALALAVRLERWQFVRPVVLQRMGDYWDNWFRHSFTWASRMNAFGEQDTSNFPGVFVALGRQRIQEIQSLRIDAPSSPQPPPLGQAPDTADGLLDSACQADFAACVAIAIQRGHFYPSFSGLYEHRTRPMIEALRTDGEVRRAMFAGVDEDEVIEAVERVVESARSTSSFWW